MTSAHNNSLTRCRKNPSRQVAAGLRPADAPRPLSAATLLRLATGEAPKMCRARYQQAKSPRHVPFQKSGGSHKVMVITRRHAPHVLNASRSTEQFSTQYVLILQESGARILLTLPTSQQGCSKLCSRSTAPARLRRRSRRFPPRYRQGQARRSQGWRRSGPHQGR